MKRIKSTLSIILTLLMVLSILPLGLISASAASTGPEWLTVAGKSYRLGEDTLPAGLSFDSGDTLTLNNYTGGAISLEAGGVDPSHYQAFIKLIGKNVISTSTGNEIYMQNSNAALYSQGELTISGDNNASLSINFDSRASGVDLYGIYVDKQYIGGTGEENPKKNFTVSGACSVNVFLSSTDDGEEMCGVYAGNIRVYSNSALDIEVEDLQKSRRYVYAAYSRGYFDINTNKWVRLDVFGDESSQAICEASNVSPVISRSSSIYLKSYDAPNFNDTSHGVRFPSGVTENDFVKSVFEGNYTSYVSKTSTLLKPITAGDVESAFNYPVINSNFNSNLRSDKFYGSVQWCYKMSSTPLPKDTIAAAGESYNAKMSLVPKAGYKLDSSALSQAQLHSVFKNRDGNMQYYYVPSSSAGDYRYGFIGGTFKAEKIKVDRIVIKDAGVPVSGQTLPSTFTVDSNAPYEYDYAKWYDETANKWADGEKAKQGHTYVFYPYVKIKDKTAYTFDALSNITASVNGNEYTEIFPGSTDPAAEIVCVKSMRYTANQTLIRDITIDTAYDPVAGELAVPAHILPDDAPYEVDTAEENGWYDSTVGEMITKKDGNHLEFQAGHKYVYMIFLKTKDPSKFVFDSKENLNVKMDGGDVGLVVNYGGDSLYVVSLSYTIYNKVNTVEISGVKAPAAGEKADNTLKVPDGALYSAEGHWFCVTDGEKEMTDADKFEYGKSYEYRVTANATGPAGITKFSDTVVMRINLTDERISADTSNITWADFTYKFGVLKCEHSLSDWKTDKENHWKECGNCKEKLESAKHVESDWIIDKAATTQAEGEKHIECTVCKYVIKTEKIDKLPDTHSHSYSDWKYDKDNHWKECSCGDKTQLAKHTESDWIIDKAATTQAEGEKHIECTVCKAVLKTEKIDKISDTHEHSYSDWKYDKDNHWKECSCGDKTQLAKHTEGDWIIDKEATKEAEGEKHIECTVCKAVIKTEKIDKIADEPVLRGDIDGNGKVNAADARLALRISAKLESPTDLQIKAGDLDADGKISAKEARMILRFAARLEKEI